MYIKYLKYQLLGLCLLISFVGIGQELADFKREIQDAKNNGVKFYELAQVLTLSSTVPDIGETPKNAHYFDYNTELVQTFFNQDVAQTKFLTIKVDMPEGQAPLVLDLVEVSYGYQMTTNKGDQPLDISQKHYRGFVRDQAAESLVAISLFKEQMSGFVSANKHTLNITKLLEGNQHMLFYDNDQVNGESTACATTAEHQNERLQEIYRNLNTKAANSRSSNSRCVRVYFEVDYDIYEHFNYSLQNTIVFTLSIFNQVAALYANDGITLRLSQIFTWIGPHLYNKDIFTGLDEFVAARPGFYGDVAHLLSFKNNVSNPGGTATGVARGTGGLCVVGNNDLSPHAYTILYPWYQTVPVYSRQVKVIAHEIGHNLGSRHTHACVWNNNNTPIDNCTQPEPAIHGGTPCPATAPLPSSGTIMSYCDKVNSVGVDFNLGFGPQPKAVIQSLINSVTCLTTCEACTAVDLTITQNIGSGQTRTERVQAYIRSSQQVQAGGEIDYHASTHITLTNGFHAKHNSKASLKIIPCYSGVIFHTGQRNSQHITHTHQAASSGQLGLYPNPTQGTFTIAIPEGKATDNRRIGVYNLMGVPIINREVNASRKVTIDLSGKPKGVYLVKYFTGHQVIVRKVIYK